MKLYEKKIFLLLYVKIYMNTQRHTSNYICMCKRDVGNATKCKRSFRMKNKKSLLAFRREVANLADIDNFCIKRTVLFLMLT